MTIRVTAMFTAAIAAAGLAVAVSSNPASAATPTTPGAFVGVAPARILDTRQTSGWVEGGSVRVLTVAGQAGVPASGVAAVAINVTVVDATDVGYVTVFPHFQSRPATSNVNFGVRRPAANLVVTRTSSDGRVDLYVASRGRVQLIVDVQGYFVGGTPQESGALVPLTPARLLDTRSGGGTRLAAGKTLPVQIADRGGVPGTAAAVVVNVTVTGPASSGYVTVHSNGVLRPRASNLNFVAGQTIANLAVVAVKNGKLDLFLGSDGAAHLVTDVLGYYIGPGTPSMPGTTTANTGGVRLLDTRTGGAGTALLNGQLVHVGGGNAAHALNVTVTQPTGHGYLAVYHDDAYKGGTSFLNFSPGQTVANLVLGRSGSNGVMIQFIGSGSVHMIVDELAGVRNAFRATRPLIESASGDAWSPSSIPPAADADPAGAGQFDAVSCADSGVCVAVGSYRTKALRLAPIVAVRSGGTWTPSPVSLPTDATGGAVLQSVSCVDASFCGAAGYYSTADAYQPLFALFSGGGWTVTGLPAPAPVDNSGFPPATAIRCPQAGSCTAIYGLGQTVDGLYSLDSGTWTGRALPVPVDASRQHASGVVEPRLDCPAVGRCVVVGTYVSTSGTAGYVVTQSDGGWTAATVALPTDATEPSETAARAVDCASPGNCTIVGYYKSTVGYRAYAATSADAAWTATPLPLPSDAASGVPIIHDIDCPATGSCVAVGRSQTTSGPGAALTLTQSAGTWTAARMPLPSDAVSGSYGWSVSCSAVASCVATAWYDARTDGASYSATALARLSGAAWTSVRAPIPADGIYVAHTLALDVDCPSVGACVAVGGYQWSPGVK